MTHEISTSHPLFGHSHLPLYVQCANELRQRLSDDIWTVGSKLPTIEVLMEELSVSRITIRQAISLLSDEGLVQAKRGLGTSVIRQPNKARPLNLSSSFEDLVNIYQGDIPLLNNTHETKDSPKVTDDEGTLLEAYSHIRRVHKRGNEKYCVISLYIADDLFQQAPDRFRNELALEVMSSLPAFKFARGWQTLRVSKANIETARLLNIPVGEPTAEVRRIICDEDSNIIYLADITYRSEYIELKMELSQ